MTPYSLLAPAKINLYLEIIGDRPDGYHELAMVMQSIALADRVDLRSLGTDQFVVLCDHPLVPADSTNLAYRAAVLMAETFPEAFNQYGGLEIAIQKRIPVGAGLAGGSTNGAAVLVGIDLMWNLGLTQSELQQLSARLGSDMPFCVSGGTAIATGRGDVLAPLPDLDHLYLVLAKYASLSVSTPWAYKTYRQQYGYTYMTGQERQEGRRRSLHSSALMTAIAHKDSRAIGEHLYNDLEKVVLPAYPQVAALRDEMKRLSPLGAMMSGSGPTVFGLAESQVEAEHIRDAIRAAIADPDLELWVTQFVPNGIQVVTPR